MPGFIASTQAWVTTAKNDYCSLEALVLARSLRRVGTARKLVVLISGDVSPDIREILDEEFDVVMTVDLHYATGLSNISWDTYARIFAWKLTLCGKCIFIAANNLIIKNCDELFDRDEFFAPREADLKFDLSLYVFRPSNKIFDKLMKLFRIGPDPINSYFRNQKFLGKSQDFPQNYIYNHRRNSSHNCITNTFKIALFGNPDTENLDTFFTISGNNNSFESGRHDFVKIWLNIFHSDIYPKLRAHMKVSEHLKRLPLPSEVDFNEKNSIEGSQASNAFSSLNREAVAVIGLSCKFPGANNSKEFWEMLVQGKDCIREVPPDRWNETQDPEFRKTKAGFLNCPIDEFDGKFFGISPREISFMDPQQRILLETSWESLEDAGINPVSLKGSKTGVFMGIWTQDYEKLLQKASNYKPEFQRTYLGNSYAATSARVSFHLGLNGPNVATESGCSSSMVSVHYACESLLRKECNLALAGGVNLILVPFTREAISATHILAVDGHCKTFDEKADGFGRAEGCGVLILKRYSEAVKDGDKILAILRGSGVTQEGTTSSFGTPSRLCQELAIKEAITNSGVNPDDVSYIEAHGTGTAVGDPTEISAIAGGYKSNHRKNNLYIGSVKTNIGHAESAAGIAGLTKVILSLKNKVIPPHRNFETLNPRINLESIPATIPTKLVEWKKEKNKPRIAGVSSFGISGTNVHIIVQEPPSVDCNEKSSVGLERTEHILTLSAKTEDALESMLENYKNYLSNTTESLADIAYSANTGRAHFSNRVAITGSDTEAIISNIKHNQFAKGKVEVGDKQRVAFLFTGQGSQYKGMSKTLYSTHPVFKAAMDKCSSVLSNNLKIPLLDVMWDDKNLSKEQSHSLDQSIYSQTAIFCVEYSLLQLWKSFGIEPDCVLGHSLGEFAAAAAAGILSLKDALKLVCVRSQLIQNLPEGGMLAVKGNHLLIEKLVNEFNKSDSLWVDIAVKNSDDDLVVAGRRDSLSQFAEMCTSSGIRTQYLAASQAFHSRDMKNILKDYQYVTTSIKYGPSKCLYISGMTGDVLADESINSQYWLSHTLKSVNFRSAIKSAYDHGFRNFIEIGPHAILLPLAMANVPISQPCIWLPSMRKQENEWTTMLSSLSKMYCNGFDIKWDLFDGPYRRSKISVPTYPFQRQKYWYESSSEGNKDIYNTNVIHPLVGRKLPLLTGDNIYRQTLELDSLPYLADHRVANKVILPGAAYLEMILAAGHAVLQGSDDFLSDPNTPLLIEDFKIEAPLELTDDKSCQVQTIVSLNNENQSGLNISVFKHNLDNSGNRSWKKHASGRFLPHASQSHGKIIHFDDVKSKCSTILLREEIYQNFPKMGLDFGKNFLSIDRVWKGDKEALAEIPIPEEAGNINEYLCHPIIIDAMIQSFAFNLENQQDLYLPIAVGKFQWFSRSQTNYLYAHSEWSGDNGSVTLYDGEGKLLVIMTGVHLLKTNISAVLNSLNTEKALPPMYDPVWRTRTGILTSRIKLAPLILSDLLNNLPLNDSRLYSDLKNHSTSVWKCYDRLCYLYILKAFYALGWKPCVGQNIKLSSFIVEFLIQNRHADLVENLFHALSEEGVFITIEDSLEWEVVKMPFKETHINQMINEVLDEIVSLMGETYVDLLLLKSYGEKLALVLRDESYNGSETLLPVHELYSNSPTFQVASDVIGAIVEKLLTFLQCKDSDAVIRILDISGVAADAIFTVLSTMSVKFAYTFALKDAECVSIFENKFEIYGQNAHFKILNIEEDPKTQGFVPQEFDVIIAADTLHKTKSLSDSVSNVNHLLAPSGLLILFETFQRQRCSDITQGIQKSYWRFSDFDIRPNNPIVSERIWRTLLENSFINVHNCEFADPRYGLLVCQAPAETQTSQLACNSSISNYSQPTWLIFSAYSEYTQSVHTLLRSYGRNTKSVNTPSSYSRLRKNSIHTEDLSYDFYKDSNGDCSSFFKTVEKDVKNIEGLLFFGITDGSESETEVCDQSNCEILLSISKYLGETNFKLLRKLYTVTKGAAYIGDQSGIVPHQSTLMGFVRAFKTENPDLPLRCIDIDPDERDLQASCKELCSELWINDGEYQIAYRNRKRHVMRLAPQSNPTKPLRMPNSDRYHLILPNSCAISDLQLGPAPKATLGELDVEVIVKATALNFRDLFIILKPDMFQSLFDSSVGTDFSGIISEVGSNIKDFKVGDAVFGTSYNGTVGSHTIVNPNLITHKPEQITFEEASTLPSVYVTAYHCLVDIAKLKPKETILIHVASGGVGLVAIQIAQSIGAEIIATAGNRRKRAYLKSLGIEHVFHSRDISYGDSIEKVTNGRGVDVVLNSLTGPNFKETTLKSCGRNARFVEIGKINIWQNEDVENLRPDVEYTIVDLEKASGEKMKSLIEKMGDDLQSRKIRALPYTKFDVSRIKDAFAFFQKAQHIGKVVVQIPGMNLVKGKLEAEELIFNSSSSYMITGGLGGIGLEVAKWMVTVGAQNIILVSRSSPNERASKVIKSLTSAGKNVIVKQADIGDLEQCRELLQYVKKELPPLRGIMHAAGTIIDRMISNLTWEQFQKVLNAKVNGGWNLHCLTKNYSLEHFVMFSSVAAGLGPLGQSNYTAANVFLDSLAHYRNSKGLPAYTINWGAWSDVGVAVKVALGNEGNWGVRPFSPNQGITALQTVMTVFQQTQTFVLDVNIPVYLKLFPHNRYYLEELSDSSDATESEKTHLDSVTFWKEMSNVTTEECTSKIKGYLLSFVRQILKLPESEKMDENQNFSAFGMDSLMEMEYRNRIQEMIGSEIRLNVASLLDHPNANSLSKYLAGIVTSSRSPSKTSEISSPEDENVNENSNNYDLVQQDAVLDENIQSVSAPCKPSEFRNIFITGVTGYYGPHMLLELLKHDHLQIHCLVRGNSLQSAKKRAIQAIRKIDRNYCLETSSKLNFVLGDITKKDLGIEKDVYKDLCSSIDAIIHCAVKVNQFSSYNIEEHQTSNALRSVNVLGTKNVFEFASKVKTKHIFYTSSFIAANEITNDGFISEDYPSENNYGRDLTQGYALTKFVCEKLAKQASERGIPCTVFRYNSIMGNSETGSFSVGHNHLMLLGLACMKLGMIDDFFTNWYTINSDTAAAISVKIMLNPNAKTGVYNIVNPDPVTKDDLIKGAQGVGCTIVPVPSSQFQQAISNQGGNSSFFMFKDMYSDGVSSLTTLSPSISAAMKNSGTVYRLSDKLLEAIPNVQQMLTKASDTIARHIAFAKSSGILKEFEIAV